MIFSIPRTLKDLNSLQTPVALPVELNDVDVDRMLTRILEMAVKRGRTAGSNTDVRAYTSYLEALHQHPRLSGFEGERGRDVLDGWVRSSILIEERSGLKRDKVVMGYLRPLTIASYRSGLPKSSSRNRGADDLLYQTVSHLIEARGSTNPTKEIDELFRTTFGAGVDVGVAPWAKPRMTRLRRSTSTPCLRCASLRASLPARTTARSEPRLTRRFHQRSTPSALMSFRCSSSTDRTCPWARPTPISAPSYRSASSRCP